MKLKFKTQAYQTAAVQAVVNCFTGQPPASAEAIILQTEWFAKNSITVIPSLPRPVGAKTGAKGLRSVSMRSISANQFVPSIEGDRHETVCS